MVSSREDRFSALYRDALPKIVAYALRRTSSPEDAADVVADTFEIAWRRLDDVPPEPAAILWLYVTARNVLSNQRRKVRRRDETVARLAAELTGLTAHAAGLDEERLVMASSVRALREEDREVLMLAGWEGLSASEIGRVIGCSATAARIRLHRARTRLNEVMTGATLQPKRSSTIGHERHESMSSPTPVSEEVFGQ